ncbi:Bcr/CflA family multidrug efflux MFS transporter [Niveispirillum cyanobacteriorum]|uniref:Bcr/CflA family efflux transporter n=1 Tax=Niveispirillum cyanobacteriorum TaxID=1612173 RepID=A0A2K9NAE3_9PROT|nr:Bcr/CflA family multidrug efflux MFS transporter [Niveispirillum cyanobacteriorum]AUN29135.1 Bcr/CflA family drug resistance efflux transporter [Niveispirillum cyanobacteriorum]GGE67181.1 Bcr/CflA family drug resistance efflux transporter [Niveispirillum cyanobacteriorum]
MRSVDIGNIHAEQAAGGQAIAVGGGLPPGTSFTWFVVVMGFLTMFGPMAIDMYLPALPSIGADLHADQAAVQMTLSIFLIGYGAGQLLWGPLGDRYGRKGPAAVGVALFILASAGCALAPDIWSLTAWRFLHGVGACAAPVIARAMVRDSFDRDRGASVMSLMMLVMGVAPMLAPLAGGQVLDHVGWRGIFWCLCVFGLLAGLGLLTVKETARPAGNRSGGLLSNYALLLLDRRFMGYALSSGFVFAGMFAYISGTPFVYIEHFGVAPEHFGFLFGVNVVALMIANVVNSRLVLRFGVDRMMGWGILATAGIGAVLIITGGFGIGGVFGVAIPLFFYLGALGLVGANGMAGSLAAFPHMAGTASSLSGALQLTIGAVAGGIVGALSAGGSPLPMCAVLCGCALAGLASDRLLKR